MKTINLIVGIVVAVAVLTGAAVAGAAAKLDRKVKPVPTATPAVGTPKIERAKLKNGLDVWVVERHELPMVTAVLQIRSGASVDGAQPGIAAMTASLLDEGTAKRNAIDFAVAQDLLGATLSASAFAEQSQVTLQTLSKNLGPALGLLGEMVAQPAFKADELERERKTRLQGLKQQKDVASTVADRVFNLVAYGEEHPYGRPASGTQASVAAITRDDIVSFYERYYRPNNSVLFVVGDVTLQQLVPQLEQGLAGWESKPLPADAAAVPAKPAAKPMAVYLVDKPGAAQSEIRIGQPGAARTVDPDYYALQVAMTALGGQFTSRVNLNLRERHGFTYGARSSITYRRGAGPLMASAGVFTAKTDSSLTEFLRELKDIRGSRPLSPEETDAARNSLVRGYPRRFETAEATIGVLGDLALYGLPDSEISNFLTQVGKVKPEDVTRVASQYIAPENLAVVVVGDLAKVRPGIEALNLGPISVLDSDGKPVVAQ
ncbi:MAG TPA: pitrilysin family protein [Candidatus Eisenbacteria bacterium]|nr:pitrilysin family protein [Candidatus Eisenbacteria bacterium]